MIDGFLIVRDPCVDAAPTEPFPLRLLIFREARESRGFDVLRLACVLGLVVRASAGCFRGGCSRGCFEVVRTVNRIPRVLGVITHADTR